ncbi:MAG: flagellar biosynthesis protein FlhB [Syntrophothermus sp.]
MASDFEYMIPLREVAGCNAESHIDLQLFAGEKTEPATPKRRQESRRKGHVSRSGELSTALVLMAVFFLLHQIQRPAIDSLTDLMREYLGRPPEGDLTADAVYALGLRVGLFLGTAILPILGVALIVGMFINFLQVGVLFTTEPLVPKFEKINPIAGAKRLFSRQALVDLIKALAKVTIIGWVAYSTVKGGVNVFFQLGDMGIGEVFTVITDLIYQVGMRVAVALLVLAIFDFYYQRWEYEKSLKMSKEDIKEEFRQMEGDPQVRARIKQRQRQIAMRRMMQQVPKADVVITNPTHIAVALRYDPSRMGAPEVVAMGEGYIARKIKEIAEANGVVLVENRPLARALYETAEIGQAIPPDLYQAVAEVLAFVYRLKRKRA